MIHPTMLPTLDANSPRNTLFDSRFLYVAFDTVEVGVFASIYIEDVSTKY